MAKAKEEPQDEMEQPDNDATQGVTKGEDAPDETVPGGRYKVGGKIVNSEGEPVKGR